MYTVLSVVRSGIRRLGRPTPSMRLASTISGERPDSTERNRTHKFRNGERVKRLFSDGEMERRLGLLREYMKQHDIGGALFTSYHNINFFGSYVYTSFGRPYGLAVTHDRSVLISGNVDGGQPWRRCYGDNIAYTDWHKDNFFHVIQVELGGVDGKIGIEFDHIDLVNFKKLNEALPKSQKVDIGEPSMDVKLLKSQEEIQVIRDGARVADIGGSAAVDALQDGAPEYVVARAANNAMVEAIAKLYPHTELMDTWSWVQSGLNTDGCHNPLTTKPIRSGENLSINCFPMIAGYYTALERTAFLNHVDTDRQLELWDINCKVFERGCELIRPGAKCGEITEELNDMYRRHDLLQYRMFGYGHSFGPMCHYYGRASGVEFREEVDTVLQEGMVVSMEPMIMIPEGMPGAGAYREHDILIVTKDGNEDITKFPYGPDHLIINKRWKNNL